MKPYRLIMLAGLLLLASAGVQSAEPAGWGTIKGQVVWGGGAIPERKEINVTQDKQRRTTQPDLAARIGGVQRLL